MDANRSILIRQGIVENRRGDGGDVPWWSFTKTVLAAAALVLVRDGRLALDERLDGRPYTLRQLLQHRAGLPEYGQLRDYHDAVARNDDAWPPAEMLARCGADRLDYRPGEGWSYSNVGYFHVRQLIESAAGSPIDTALHRLVLGPLAIDGVRLALQRGDLSPLYDPKWVYHGLLLGPLEQAAKLLQRLFIRQLLPRPLLSAMLDRYSVGGPVENRPWKTPSYGLGLMIGRTTSGELIAGHTGGGPGSVVAVYHHLDGTGGTAAAFASGGAVADVERACVDLLRRSP